MRPSTFYQMLQDIVLSLRYQGFRRFVVLLGHGGVYIADPAIRELNALYDDIEIIKCGNVITEKAKTVLTGDDGIHADELETSLMLYLHEHLVKKDLMMHNDFVPECPREFLNYTSILEVSPTGAWGKPSLATKEKGEKMLEIIAEACVEYIEEAFRYTNRNEW